ncbi:unnamed protein product [Cercopithifilaria johnstoni]|uniref:Uncharacterized protein n=1 Tax=Cercopithifilaria johnstoni TaxID=2874296 RepID=A0A8J2LQ30_9BILA|nr:unnamed protein product [Cercopithifilaria johnstoni]
MFHLIFTIIVFASKQCNGQLGYGGNGYCSTCTLSNSGSILRGFGFGGGNYGSSSNTGNSDLTSQSLYSLPTNNAFIVPSNSYGYGTNGYGTGTGYGGAQTSNTANYGSPSTAGMTWNNAYSSIGNYGTRNGYINCYNNNCIPSSGYNVVPSASASIGTGYDISGNNALYNSYSSLPDTNYKTYSFPSAYSVYSNLGSLLNTGNSNSALETSYSLPATYTSYPTVYGSYDNQGSVNSPNNLNYFNYQRNRQITAADDASVMEKSSSSSTSISS